MRRFDPKLPYAALLWLFVTSTGVAAPQQIDIAIRARAVPSDVGVVRVTEGDSVELHVSTDEAVSLHLHGYDVEFTVAPEKTTVIAFEAFATGRFPISSHGWAGDGDTHQHGHEALLYLEVHPR